MSRQYQFIYAYPQNHLECAILCDSKGIRSSEGILPVSYTHLDVYKRQTLLREVYGKNLSAAEKFPDFQLIIFVDTDVYWSVQEGSSNPITSQEFEMCIRDSNGTARINQGD